MIPAREPRALREAARLLVVGSATATLMDRTVSDLPDLLQPGDLLVVNDAATLPASLAARTASGSAVEIRLVAHAGGSDWTAVLLGEGDWTTPTELRVPPEQISIGTVLEIGHGVEAEVICIDESLPRLVTIRFLREGAGMWSAIFAYGRPVQYSYLRRSLDLWSVQTSYGSRPWAVEMPSAGYPLTWRILLALKRRGVGIGRLTHAAGLSSIGNEDVDARLPFAERFDIPQATIDAINATHKQGCRVIAVGTTVVRALEGCAKLNNGKLVHGNGVTDLVMDKAFRLSIVDGLLTGIHDPAQSHFRLMEAFADESTLRRVWHHATEQGYLCHEFGDVCLIAADPPRSSRVPQQ